MDKKTGIISFNAVQENLYHLLKSKDHNCEIINPMSKELLKKCIFSCERVVLPFPSVRKNLSAFGDTDDLSAFFSKHQLVIGGMLDDGIKEQFKEEGIRFFDYYTYEPYVLRNAFLTSQGVLRLLFDNTEKQAAGRNALVTGFGRIAKSLALMLKGIGVKVSVAVRSDLQAAEAASLGFDVFRLSSLKSIIFYFDFVFNTVPCRLFCRNDIKHIRDDTVYFEIASSPFGADESDFTYEKKKFVNASALPGRLYPKAVAENIYELILNNSELMKGGNQ